MQYFVWRMGLWNRPCVQRCSSVWSDTCRYRSVRDIPFQLNLTVTIWSNQILKISQFKPGKFNLVWDVEFCIKFAMCESGARVGLQSSLKTCQGLTVAAEYAWSFTVSLIVTIVVIVNDHDTWQHVEHITIYISICSPAYVDVVRQLSRSGHDWHSRCAHMWTKAPRKARKYSVGSLQHSAYGALGLGGVQWAVGACVECA